MADKDKDIVAQLQNNLKEKIAEVKKILNALHTLKEFDDSIEVPEIITLFGDEGGKSEGKHDHKSRPDEFYGMAQTDAAEKFLRKIGHAVPLDSIYLALQAGGIRFTANGKNALNVQLTRGTRKFVKMRHGDTVNFGLIEWYPKRRKEPGLTQGTNIKVTDAAEGKGKGSTDTESAKN